MVAYAHDSVSLLLMKIKDVSKYKKQLPEASEK